MKNKQGGWFTLPRGRNADSKQRAWDVKRSFCQAGEGDQQLDPQESAEELSFGEVQGAIYTTL